MRRYVSHPLHGLLRNEAALIAASRGTADQPYHSIAARSYHSCQRLSSPVPLRDTWRRRISASHSPFTAPRRSLNTEVVVDANAAAASNFPTFAFAFDIDGVLLRSSKPLPGASEALLYLQKNNIPFILLTNGGGQLESERVAELSKSLGVPLLEENLVQSHTPIKALAHGKPLSKFPRTDFKDKVVLVTGGDGDKCRQVAESYGFTKVVTPGDIVMAYPDIWPFSKVFSDSYKASCRPLPHPIDPANPTNSLKIDAIFVFNDPRDWALDTQIIVDLLMSKDGVLGTISEKNGNSSLPSNGYQSDGQPKILFSNPDLLWAAEYHMPRLGQGGFEAALVGVWMGLTTMGLRRTKIGKPYQATYSYAESVLVRHRKKLLNNVSGRVGRVGRLERVFMVGDNPASDIKGANNYHGVPYIPWTSILVKTGVFQDGAEPEFKPKVIVDNVLDAVKWALKEEGWQDKFNEEEEEKEEKEEKEK